MSASDDAMRSNRQATESAELRTRLDEAESVLKAIRRGEIDAVVVGGADGDRVFTLEGADHPYRIMVESMNEGAATLTSDGCIVYANPWLASRLGVARERLTGARFAEWVAAEHARRFDDLLRASEREPVSGELTLVAGDGTPLPVHGSFGSLDIDGERFCCAILTDLSLAKHHAALKTAAEQIREANERLLESDRRKDEFLATLAHELRNPLASIDSAVRVLGMLGHEDARFAQTHGMLERQVTHMTRLVDDLLELSRITHGKIDFRPQRRDLAAVLKDVGNASRSSLKPEQSFSVEQPDEPLLVDIDEIRFSQALSNVLENAFKYTPAAGRIELGACREASFAVVRVRDNGAGIARDLAPRVFDMFFRIDRDGRRGQQGLGIGLALTRRLIEMHGGTIDVSSAGPGRGSEFTIRLPLAERRTAETGRLAEASAGAASPRNVLIVDDNVDAAESLRTLLELFGHTVRAVHRGAAAFDAMEQFRPDFVLLDMGLPDLDGYEVARRLRGRYGDQCPTLVAVSGWGRPDDKERAAEAGIDAYFTKPVSAAALTRIFVDGPPRRS